MEKKGRGEEAAAGLPGKLPALARRTRCTRTCFVDTKRTPAEIVTFKCSDRFVSFIFIRHLNEPETAETACFFIVYEFN